MTREELNKLMTKYFKKGGVVTVYATPKTRTIGQTVKRAKRASRRLNADTPMGYRTTNWKAFTA